MTDQKFGRVRVVASQISDRFVKLKMVIDHGLFVPNVTSKSLRFPKAPSIHRIDSYAMLFCELLKEIPVLFRVVAITWQEEQEGFWITLGLITMC